MSDILVDEENKHLLEQTWYVNKRGYVQRDVKRKNRKRYLLHRVIMNAKKGQLVDHKNGNKLDNRKENLRIVTKSENNHNAIGLNKRNTSGYRGVTWDKKKNKWMAQGCVNSKHKFIGYFETAKEASIAAQKWRLANMPGALN
jgi:hypothetical protein